MKLTPVIALGGVKKQLEWGIINYSFDPIGSRAKLSMVHLPMVLSPAVLQLDISHTALRKFLRFDYNFDFHGHIPAFSTRFAAGGCLSLLHELVNASLAV